MTLLIFLVVLSWTNAVASEYCPASPISGSAYSRTIATLSTAQNWLRKHQDTLKDMNFVPKVKPREGGGVLPASETLHEEILRKRKAYSKAHITNDIDFEIHFQLDLLDQMVMKNPKKAHNKFKRLFEEHKSPRALFGQGVALNRLSLLEETNPHEAKSLQGKAANRFCRVLTMDNVPLFLFMVSGRTCLELRRHRHERVELITALKLMRAKFPNAYEYASELGLEYLKRRQFLTAKDHIKATLKRWPQKAGKEKILLAIACKWLQYKSHRLEPSDQEAINSLNDPLRSFFLAEISSSIKSLAEFYLDSGFYEEANFFHEVGAQLGIFPSKWQRQLYDNNFYIPSLTSKPIWSLSELPLSVSDPLKEISNHWKTIRREGLKALFGRFENFEKEAANLKEEGQWQQLVLFEKGHKHHRGCELAPKTCQLIEKWMPETASSCTRGQVKFSVMHKDTHVWPHSGPTNTRLRAHLGLVVPSKGRVEMRIADQTIRWSEGKVFVIDDSFEHEVWQQGETIRLVLLIDFWHPDLSSRLKTTLSPLPIDDAKNQTTVFHIGGIVSEITSSVTSNPVTEVIARNKLTGNL